MIDWLFEYLREHWDILGWASRPPRDVRFLVQSRSRVVVFVVDESKRPRLIVKLSRDPTSASRTRNEAGVLCALRERLPEEFRETIPLVLHLDEHNGRLMEFESPVLGKPLPLTHVNGVSRQRFDPIFVVYNWLLDFQSWCPKDDLYLDTVTLADRFVAPVFSCLDKAGVDHSPLQRILARADDLQGLILPVLYRHGDLHPTNVLVSEGRVSGVVDWEVATTASLPFYDWFQFLFEYVLEITKRRHPTWQRKKLWHAAIHQLLPPVGPQRGIHAWMVRFLACYGISATLAPFLWLWFASQVFWPGDRSELVRVFAQTLTDSHSASTCSLTWNTANRSPSAGTAGMSE